MIVHVWRRAMEADVGPVLVAAAEAEIVDAIDAAGGHAMLTRSGHATGSDRVFEALESWGGRYDAVINLQGDLPLIAPGAVRTVLGPLDDADVDIATLAAPITEAAERDDESVVKAVISVPPGSCAAAPFTSAAPRCLRVRGRFTITSASMPTARRPWRGSSPFPGGCWSAASGSSSCARWRPACASTPPSLTRFPSVSILPPTSSARAPLWLRARPAHPSFLAL